MQGIAICSRWKLLLVNRFGSVMRTPCADFLSTGGYPHPHTTHHSLPPQLDMRQPDASSVPSWQLSADVEALAWDPHHPTQFVVSSEDGVVAAYDARQV